MAEKELPRLLVQDFEEMRIGWVAEKVVETVAVAVMMGEVAPRRSLQAYTEVVGADRAAWLLLEMAGQLRVQRPFAT